MKSVVYTFQTALLPPLRRFRRLNPLNLTAATALQKKQPGRTYESANRRKLPHDVHVAPPRDPPAGLRLRVTAEGRFQAAGLTPGLRPAVKRHRARLKAYVQGRTCTLESPRIRWAYPPCTADWYAWAPGADKEHVPPGLEVADWT